MEQEIINYIKTLSNNDKIQKILIETISKILSKQENLNNFIQENEIKIIHIHDWITSIVENGEDWKTPRVLTIDALNNTANKYFQKKNNKLQIVQISEKKEKLIAELGEYYVIQMLTSEALDNESKIMQHCIGHGGYDERLKNPDYQYLSLRDKFNKAHVTLEIYKNNEILQIQGKQNKLPEEKYLNNLLPWLINNNYKNIPWHKFDKFLEDNKWIEFKDISITENIDYIHNNYKNLQIQKSLSEKFNLKYFYKDKIILNRYLLNNFEYFIVLNNSISIIFSNEKYYVNIFNVDKFLKTNFSFNELIEYINIEIKKEKNNDNQNDILDVEEMLANLVNKNYTDNFNQNHFKKIFENQLSTKGLYLNDEGYVSNILDIKTIKNIDYIIDKYKNLTIKIRKTEKFEKFYEKYIEDYYLKSYKIDFVINDYIYFLSEKEKITDYKNDKDFKKVYIKDIKDITLKEKKQIAEYILYTDKLNISEKNRRVNLFGYHLTTENKLIKCNNMKLKKDIDYKDISENGLNIIECVSAKAISYFYNKYFDVYYKKYGDKTININNIYSPLNKLQIINDNIFLLITKKLDPNPFPRQLYLYHKKEIKIEEKEKIFDYIRKKYDANYCKRSLDISNTNIKDISQINDINNITYELNISNCSKLKKIPDNLNIRSLQAKNSRIRKLPNNIILDTLTLSKNTKIKKLPKNLIINSYLYLSDTKIKKLPDNLTKIKVLTIYETKIKKLPNNLRQDIILGIAFCKKIKKLPDNLSCKEIFIDSKQIKLIKETINFDHIYIYDYYQYKKNKLLKYLKINKTLFFKMKKEKKLKKFLKENIL